MNERIDIQLVRCYCDGEASLEECCAVEAMLSGSEGERLRQEIETERRLRAAVCECMQRCCPSTPEAVRAHVESSLASADSAAQPEPAVPAGATSSSSRPSRLAASLREQGVLARLFGSPQRMNFAAVAAVLAMIAGVVIYSIYAPTIDQSPRPSGASVIADAGAMAASEHTACSTDPQRALEKAVIVDPALAERELSAWLDRPVEVFDLEAMGYWFVGGGRCALPVSDVSYHLMYCKTGRKLEGPMVSIFMAPLRGEVDTDTQGRELFTWYACEMPPRCRHAVMYCTDGAMVYLLVCCDDRDLRRVAEHLSRILASGR